MKKILITVICILYLNAISFGQFLNNNQLEFISEHAISLNVDHDYQNGDYEQIINIVADKRLVLIGEFNHGSKEVFITRTDLIKELHKEHGFDLILFESGIGEVGIVNLQLNNLEGRELTSGFFGGWQTTEFIDLLQYSKEQGIEIAGFDVQRTGTGFSSSFSEELEDPSSFINLEQRFGALKTYLSNYRTDYDSIRVEAEQLVIDYLKVKVRLQANDHFNLRVLENRISYLNYMLEFTRTKDWNRRWAERDRLMAENIKWTLNQYGPDQKAIIVAHNFHISRYNEREEVMGEFLQKEYDEEMYVLGVFGLGGEYHNNFGETEALSLPDTSMLDIKHVIATDGARMSFLNIPEAGISGSSWLFEPIVVNDTFIDLSRSNSLILSKAFDGLLFLDSVSPPLKE